jgi:hypothetical protein
MKWATAPSMKSTIGDWQLAIANVMAERVGFEPTERFPAHSISSAANSTTLAPLPRNCLMAISNWQFKALFNIQSKRNLQSAIGNRQFSGGEGGI